MICCLQEILVFKVHMNWSERMEKDISSNGDKELINNYLMNACNLLDTQ